MTTAGIGSYEDTANLLGGINESHLTMGHTRQAKPLPDKRKHKSLPEKKASHTTSWNDRSKSFQQLPQEDATQLHFDIAAATQKQRQKKVEDNTTRYTMYSNFKSYHHLLIDSGAFTLRTGSTTTTLWRISSATLHGYQQEDPCLWHQVCSLQAGQL